MTCPQAIDELKAIERCARSRGTPGPWEVVENPDSGGGDTVISNAASIYSDDETYVADVYRGYVGSESVTHDQQIANARLIAAAPELLEACQHALPFVAAWAGFYQHDHGLPDLHPRHKEAIKQVKCAIAKATGGDA